jgi:hypothetical protein
MESSTATVTVPPGDIWENSGLRRTWVVVWANAIQPDRIAPRSNLKRDIRKAMASKGHHRTK